MVDGAWTGLIIAVTGELRMVIGEDRAGAMEVIVINESNLWVTKIANKSLKSALFNPRRSLDTVRSRHVNHITLITRPLHD